MKPKVIVPLRARTWAELEPKLEQLTAQVDIVEIWLDQLFMDLMRQPGLIPQVANTLQQLKESIGISLLAVCKGPQEGGQFGGTAAQRVEILQAWLQLGGDYVDVDVQHNPKELIRQLPLDQVWLSAHDFDGLPDLEQLQRDMQMIGPSVYKFAVTPGDEDALSRFLSFAEKFPKPGVFTTMGPLGEVGRSKLKDTTWGAFYALSDDEKTAPGQPTLDTL